MNSKQWLDKIQWDKNESPNEYTLTYINFGKEREISYDEIINKDVFSFSINQEGQLAYIPYHRIRKIKKKGEIVFQRRCIKSSI